MKLQSTITAILLSLAMITILASCEKGWLEAKPDKSLIVPRTLEDYQLLLNDRRVFGVKAPMSGEIAADDAYVPSEIWKSLNVLSRNTYVWANDIYEGGGSPDWNLAYERILQANIVLDGIQSLETAVAEKNQKNSIKGQALFYRALSFYDLSQLFCKPYDPVTADTDLGLPLKLKPDVHELVSRSTLQQTYDRIIHDLVSARQLLPETQEWKTMPTKNAASGLLARIYLSMEEYVAALKYANESLEMNSDLLDYNTLDPAVDFPLPLFNEEVVWHGELGGNASHANRNGIIDTVLYDSYSEDDLRKVLFFRKEPDGVHFRGQYNGVWTPVFCGIANDELYLIRAECLVRTGQIAKGMDVLNKLLRNRWKKDEEGMSTYIDRTAADETEALNIILEERRKELILRGVRWSDLRRLNRDDRFEKTLVRVVNGSVYTLPPNDPRYTFLIPPDEIILGRIEQNPR